MKKNKILLLVVITVIFAAGFLIGIIQLKNAPLLLIIAELPLIIIYVLAIILVLKLDKFIDNKKAYRNSALIGIAFLISCVGLIYPIVYLKLESQSLLMGIRIIGGIQYIVVSLIIGRYLRHNHE